MKCRDEPTTANIVFMPAAGDVLILKFSFFYKGLTSDWLTELKIKDFIWRGRQFCAPKSSLVSMIPNFHSSGRLKTNDQFLCSKTSSQDSNFSLLTPCDPVADGKGEKHCFRWFGTIPLESSWIQAPQHFRPIFWSLEFEPLEYTSFLGQLES